MQQITPTFTASVLRRDDMLALRFEFFNLALQGNALVRQQAAQPAYIVAQLAHGTDSAPQSVAEEVFLEAAPEFGEASAGGDPLKAPGSLGVQVAGPSRLAFQVPNGVDVIPFQLDALLGWEAYEQSVADHALPPAPPSLTDPARIQVSAAGPPITVTPGPVLDLTSLIREPTATETAIEAPWRLIVSPSRVGGWAHARSPVVRNGRTELWHTRLGVRGAVVGSPGVFAVREDDAFFRTLRAIWTLGFDRTQPPFPGQQFQTSLTPNDRWQLVRLTSDYVTFNLTPAPVQVERLMLTALGAWLDVRGSWTALPDPLQQEGLDISQWQHRATMGRDQYVRVVKEGFLFPLGHAAALVRVTERKLETVPSGPLAGASAAYLRQRRFSLWCARRSGRTRAAASPTTAAAGCTGRRASPRR